MPQKMNRGKNQIMYNYLPGKVFDFDKSSVIAHVDYIRGFQRTDLNIDLILHAVKNQAAAWRELASIFINPRSDQFVLIEPKKVYSKIFPKVFWCQNKQCGGVFDYSHSDAIPNQIICPVCKHGKLAQLRFVRIHQCGDIKPLTPPYECNICKTKNQFSLDTRNSERISQFVWICRNCNSHLSLFSGQCTSCNWESIAGEKNKQQMSIEVHRASRVFYPKDAVLLNQPGTDINIYLGINKWQLITGGFFMELSELEGLTIKKYTSEHHKINASSFVLSDKDIAQFKKQGKTDEQIDQFRQMQALLFDNHQIKDNSLTPEKINQSLVQQTGVPERIWISAGQELLEATLLFQSNNIQDLLLIHNPTLSQLKAKDLASQLGASRISLVSDFPMTHITFGYSRSEYAPGECRLNPFPLDSDHKGKFPLFVDTIQADAIVVQLDSQRIFRWLEKIGYQIQLPNNVTDNKKATCAHFIQLFNDLALQQEPVILTQTLRADYAEARLVFGLLHTMSHMFLKKAALLCGLDQTSLSEYILPSALIFAIYSNHRFGATIGALSSLFEQSLSEWLGQILTDTRRCIYDPVCQTKGGNCHACTQLAETSCRFYNVNLGRPFLFGGFDSELGDLKCGYLDSTLNKKYE